MTDTVIRRISRDLEKFAESEIPGIWLDVDEDNIRKMKAIIVGPDDTVYTGAFMYFDIDISDRYPFVPPKVKHLTHETKNCRLHPNLYDKEGKVCLSILGTWQGPGWASTMSLTTVLVSIQALLDNEPLRHEPGYDKEDRDSVVKSFSKATEFNALDVGVLEMIKRTDIPEELRNRMKDHFRKNMEKYLERANFLNQKYSSPETIKHMYHETKTNFQDLYERMKTIVNEMKEEPSKITDSTEHGKDSILKQSEGSGKEEIDDFSEELYEGF